MGDHRQDSMGPGGECSGCYVAAPEAKEAEPRRSGSGPLVPEGRLLAAEARIAEMTRALDAASEDSRAVFAWLRTAIYGDPAKGPDTSAVLSDAEEMIENGREAAAERDALRALVREVLDAPGSVMCDRWLSWDERARAALKGKG